MAFIAPKHEGAKRPRIEGNKCHASRLSVRDITSLYPVGIATIDTHRILKKKGKAKLSYSKQTHKAAL